MKIERAARLLAGSNRAIALTGAGLSTGSGIPDFRGPETGLWARADVPQSELLAATSIYTFGRDPQEFYNRMRPLLQVILNAHPNPAHVALAELEAMGILHALITQNADGLHQEAGSQNVLEVHGTLAKATCIRCYREKPARAMLEQFLSSGTVPRCPECGGVMKPNVILTGEQLPAQVMLAARQAVKTCDLMLVAGTSLPGGPASDLPDIAYRYHARVIIVNMSTTLLDSLADVVIHEDVVTALPAITECIKKIRSAG